MTLFWCSTSLKTTQRADASRRPYGSRCPYGLCIRAGIGLLDDQRSNGTLCRSAGEKISRYASPNGRRSSGDETVVVHPAMRGIRHERAKQRDKRSRQ
jgi:hypothetical protein